jgi:DNA-binding NtrC family response regulator
MRVRRLGRGTMRVNGNACEEAVLRPGDTLGFGQSLLFLYVRRPASLPSLRHFDRARMGTFGGADAFGMVGESPAAWMLREQLAFAAKANAHVLIVGESGTGKELAARAIRLLSSRPDASFVARNAATLPPGLADAELFGNPKNYPNPGMLDRPGIVGEAHQGFLFLDEIGEMPIELQAHMLRVLDSGGEYQRLGESGTRRSKFRLIAATNRPPSALKADFLARLTVRVDVPPLAERREDVALLIHRLVERAAERSPEVAGRFLARRADGSAAARVDALFIESLVRRDFALNTRDLDSLLWEAMAHSDGDIIVWRGSQAAAPGGGRSVRRRVKTRNPEVDEATIREALARAGGSPGLAAKDLELTSRHVLTRRMKKLGITR